MEPVLIIAVVLAGYLLARRRARRHATEPVQPPLVTRDPLAPRFGDRTHRRFKL